MRVFSFMNAGYEGLNFLLKTLYVFSGQTSANAVMAASGLGYDRVHPAAKERATGLSGFPLLATLMFALRFVQWWREQSLLHPAAGPATAALPAPLDYPPKHCDSTVCDVWGACPLCGSAMDKPAAIPTGRVFCEPCISRHLAQHHRCPITFVPVESSEIRPLFIHGS